jgi:hypothetical protein
MGVSAAAEDTIVGEAGAVRDAVHRAPTGMALWLALPLSWLLGVAGQLSEPVLRAPQFYRGTLWTALGLCVALLLWQRQRGATTWQRWLWCPVMVLLAWGSTGWRAQERATQVWPSSWDEVPVRVRVTGLPQPLSGGTWRFDARLLQAPTPPAGTRLPEHIRLYADAQAGMATVAAGQVWALNVRLHEPDGLSNPGGFDATRGVFEQGIRAAGSVRHRVTPTVESE